MSNPDTSKSVFELTGQAPDAWLMEATVLKKAADLVRTELTKVFTAFPHGFTTHRRPPFEDMALCGPYMLLSGLALENLIKGIIVGRNPRVVTATTFALKNHTLRDLAQQVTPTLSENELDI